jgi:thioredoxin-dependent peroxiredoxin
MKKLFFTILLVPLVSFSSDLKVGSAAPVFKAKTHTGDDFWMEHQKGKWTILYFYPKADTPGCTKQACAFRDNIKKITALGAEVYGISVNSVEEQAAFHKKHGLKFSLIADEKADIAILYGAKMPMIKMSKRWTFIIDEQLKIRKIEKDVDPVSDAESVADFISKNKK